MITFLSRRAAADPAGETQSSSTRRPWWVWVVPFAVVLGVLLVRNAFLFSTPLYEDGDPGANSILIEQARRFTLLVGNYSREGFNHPGPAFLYVQSWGETLFWSVLHVVPTAWNGELIAVFALNSLFAALVVGTCHGWAQSVRGAAAAFAVVLMLGAMHPSVFSNDWMPYVYVLGYFAFLVSVTSVAAGQTRHLWVAATTGWFCIHGHACYLLFVPFLTCCAIGALAWPRRSRLSAALKEFWTGRRRDWLPALVISMLFLVPILGELILHWPGNFGKYFGYGSSAKAGGHGLGQDIGYVLWFWWPHTYAWLVVVVLFAAAVGAARWLPIGGARRFCWFLIAFDAISTLLLVSYAAVGVDDISQHYIEYFAWTAPITLVLVIAIAVVCAMPEGRMLANGLTSPRVLTGAPTGVAVAALLAAGGVFATATLTRTNTGPNSLPEPANPPAGLNTDPSLPAAVTRLASVAGGRPVVLKIQQPAWVEMTGVLVQAERTGVTAFVADLRDGAALMAAVTPQSWTRTSALWNESAKQPPHPVGCRPLLDRRCRTPLEARLNAHVPVPPSQPRSRRPGGRDSHVRHPPSLVGRGCALRGGLGRAAGAQRLHLQHPPVRGRRYRR
jgi:hypothetical protein